MLKKILIGALLAISAIGITATSEASHRDYDCRDGYCARDSYCDDYCYNDREHYRGYYGRGCGCRG